MSLWLLLAGAYLVGSIPVGYLAGRMRGVDLRSVGSGNIGATNALRVLGTKAGAAVLLADVLKGLGPTLAARAVGFTGLDLLLVGMAAVIGHMYSVFLGFRGGKGVASGLGALIGAVPFVALLTSLTFAVVLVGFRWVSLASVAAAVSVGLYALVLGEPAELTYALIALGLLVVYRHRANFKRLLSGSEPKVRLRKGARAIE